MNINIRIEIRNIPTRDNIFLIQSGLTNYKSTKNTAQQVGWGVTRVKIITPLLPPSHQDCDLLFESSRQNVNFYYKYICIMYLFSQDARRLWRKSRGLRKPFIPNAIGMHLPWRNDLYLIRNIWLSCLYRSAALSCCDDMQPAENCVMSGHSPRQTSTQAWNWTRLSQWIENVWRFNYYCNVLKSLTNKIFSLTGSFYLFIIWQWSWR